MLKRSQLHGGIPRDICLGYKCTIVITDLLFSFMYDNLIVAQEQFFIMKPEAVCARSFKLYTTTDQAANYKCTGWQLGNI